jgi:FkbM family methyltransferase
MLDCLAMLGDAWRAMLRLSRSVNLPYLRELEYEEGNNSQFRFANAGPEVYVTLDSDNYISRSLASIGSYDFSGLEVAARLIGHPLELLFDVGANIGSISIPAVARGYSKRAVAVEPDSLNFRTLMANIWLNDLQNSILAVNTALGESPDEILTFQLSPDNKGDHRVRTNSNAGVFGEENWPTVNVPSTNLDALAFNNGLFNDPEKALVWVDVQGWESKVLAGAKETLKQKTPFVLEFWPYGLNRNDALHELVSQVASHFIKIHVISWPGAPVFPSTAEGMQKIIQQLDPSNALSACDLLLT